jgi:serine/threonine protein phosphatase PrpC
MSFESDDACALLAQRLQNMAEAVREGNFDKAETFGGIEWMDDVRNPQKIPLAVPKSVLGYSRESVLSEGAQSSVHRGQWDGKPVAIKRGIIREPQDLLRFRKEVCMLGSISHENIVSLVGARMLPPDYLLIMDLYDTSAGSAIYNQGWKPSLEEVIYIGCQISVALDVLHSHTIVHRDVKPGNILLHSGNAALTDFGIADFSNIIEETFHSTASGKSPSGGFYKASMMGTLEYMAPEILLKKQPASPASDIFALSITINELLACMHPYSDCTRDNPLAHTILEVGYNRQDLVVAVAAEGLRPTIPAGIPAKLRALINLGWHADPMQRPTASWLAKELYSLLGSDAGTCGLLSLEHLHGNIEERITTHRGEKSLENSIYIPDPPRWALVGSSIANVPVGVFATAGKRGEDNMEDRSILLRQPFASENVLIAGIFDGHRGYEASDYVSTHLESLLRKHWTDSQCPSDLLKSVLHEAEEEFQAVWNLKNSQLTRKRYPGTTALCMILCNNTLTVANIGDSRAMLCRNGRPFPLSIDQIAERSDERNRIEQSGYGEHLCQHDGSWRVGSVGLAVTRSIGDHDMKQQGIISEPEISQTEIHHEEDAFVVLASDGVWDVLTGEELIQLVKETVKQPAMCAQRIVIEALTKGSDDNASAIVAFLDPRLWTTFEKVS